MNTKSKIILILLATLIVLTAVYYLWQNPLASQTKAQETIIDLTKLDKVQKIEIIKKEQTIVLTKQDNKWQVNGETNTPANETLINNLLDSLKSNPTATIVSQNPDKLVNFNLTAELATTLKLSDEQNNVIAEILIGKLGPTFQNNYLKSASSANVLLFADNLITKTNQSNWQQPAPAVNETNETSTIK